MVFVFFEHEILKGDTITHKYTLILANTVGV